jgi:hypothetical protein
MAITLYQNGDITSFAAAAAETACLVACALIALWWGNSKTHADLRFHRGNSKTPKLVLAAEAAVVSQPNSKTQQQDPEAGVVSPPKRDSPQFTSVYDLALWKLHSQADQPAGEIAREAAPEPKADVDSKKLPQWPCPKPPASPSQGDLGLDFQAFLGGLEQHFDLAMDGLCEQAVVEQGTPVLMDLERDCEASSDGGFPTSQLDTELPRDGVPEPEDEQDRTYEDLCDSALVDLELDMELLRDVVLEPEREQDRADDDMCASHLVDIEEPDWRLLGEVESAASQQLLEAQTAAVLREQHDWRPSFASQAAAGSAPEDRIGDILEEHARLIQRVHKMFAEYMLWVI